MFSIHQRILKKIIKISTKTKTLSNTMFYIQYIYHVVNPSLSVFLQNDFRQERSDCWRTEKDVMAFMHVYVTATCPLYSHAGGD